MNKLLLIGLTLLLSSQAFGQINMADSTVQVIGYWDNKEKQTYSVTFDKYKVEAADTLSKERITYEVDVTIIDSTAKSYTIEWYYKDFKINSDNQFTKKLASISQDIKVIIRTNEMGEFAEVVNWVEVGDYVKKSITALKEEFKDIPKINEIADQVGGMFSTKEAIESAAIKDIHQFYTYHGAKYKLGEDIEAKIKVPNLYGGEPFDTDVTIRLDEIRESEGNSIIRMWQTIDSQQLTEASFAYIKEMAKITGAQTPNFEGIPPLKNEISTSSLIHGGSGWVVYSVEKKEVSAEDTIGIEERVIELK